MDENRHEEDEEEDEDEDEDDEDLTHHPIHDSSNSLEHIFASSNRYYSFIHSLSINYFT